MHCAKCFFYETDVGDDVCNRCGRAYLPEANVYLGLVLLVTGGAALALRALVAGQVDPFVRPALDLGAWVTWPVSIVYRPAYGFVIGAWLGMLAASPILTGLLYGKRGGWLLAILLAALGPSVLLAAVTALGVWIAAGRTCRLSSKLAGALLGLVPVAVFWFVATAMTDFTKGESVAAPGPAEMTSAAVALKTLPPALRSLAYVAPVTATVTAALAAVLVVLVGRADRWHVRWPGAAVTVLTAGPVVALVALVGLDEVRYGLLREPLLALKGGALPPSEMDRFQGFLSRCPTGRRAAEIRAHLAMDLEEIEDGLRAGQAARRSEEVWQELVKLHPASPWAGDARLHLGDAAARQGLFDQAEQMYRSVISQTVVAEAPAEDPLAKFTVPWDLLAIGPALDAKENAQHLGAVRREALLRLALVLENRGASQDPTRALAMFVAALRLKGTNHFRDRLRAAAEADPKGALADNVAYELAMLEPDMLKRIENLARVMTAYPGTDGAMLAHVGAARVLLALAVTDPGALREARQHLEVARADLARRGARSPLDPYVAALGESVEKELVYVQAQLRKPEEKR